MKRYRILISLEAKGNMHFLPITACPLFEMWLNAENKTKARSKIKQNIKGPFKVTINQIKEMK